MVQTRAQAGEASNGSIPRVPLFRVSSQLESLDSGVDRRSLFYREQALQKSQPVERQRQTILTLPTMLTMLRVALVPVLVLCWYHAHVHAPVATAAVFILASITDWLDGYLARRMGLVSAFGAFLDPVADKIMVSTALVLLATEPPPPISQQPWLMTGPVATIIAREIANSALREWAAAAGGEAHKAVKVSSLGKWKTALQMTAMSLLLVLRNDHLIGDSVAAVLWLHRATLASYALLVGATLLSLWSLFLYMRAVWEHFVYVQVKQH